MYGLAWALCFLVRCADGTGNCGWYLMERALQAIEIGLYAETPRGWVQTVGDSASWRLAACDFPDSVTLEDGSRMEVIREEHLLVRAANRGVRTYWEVARDPRYADPPAGPISVVRCWDFTLYEGGSGTKHFRMGVATPMDLDRQRSLAGELYAALPWRCEK